MPHTQQVDIVKAVLGAKKMVVYGEDLLRHIVVDGEAMAVAIAEIPIGRIESAAVLEEYFTLCPRVTMAEVLKAGRQISAMEQVMASDPRLNQDEP